MPFGRAGQSHLQGWLERSFGLVALFLLAVMATVQILSIRQETQTWDEGLHLAAGYHYLRTCDYRMSVEHPPLARVLNALPLLFLDLDLPKSVPDADEVLYARKFLYENRVPADRILFTARCVTIAFTLALGIGLALWTRRRFGGPVALLALTFFAVDPNIIAHGRYITTDLFFVAFTFFACIGWSEYLRKPTVLRLVLAGAALGCALASKTSALFLPPVFAVLYVIHWWYQGKPRGWLSLLKELALSSTKVGAIAVLVLMLTYMPEVTATVTYLVSGRQDLPFLSWPLASRIGRQAALGELLFQVAQALHLPSYSYLVGLGKLSEYWRVGQPAYLLGKISTLGWWYYFPIAVMVKTPTATLALLAIVAVAGLLEGVLGIRRRVGLELRKWPFEWHVLAIPSALFFATAVTSAADIGLRHVLCIYPLLIVLLCSMFVSKGPSLLKSMYEPVLFVLVFGLIAESLFIYPHYLAFFNWPSGGPGNGPHYLLDSNIDWGQDLKKLKTWADVHHPEDLRLKYFGSAPVTYYGFRNDQFPPNMSPEAWAELSFVAVSATLLRGLYLPEDLFAPLRKREPVAKVGYSIYVYDLRWGNYDDTNSRITYQGNWIRDLQFSQADRGTLTYSNEAGATLQFDFQGTELTYSYTKAFNRGLAEVSIDGIQKAKLDLYSKTTEWKAKTVFGGLNKGRHHLVIQVTGAKNPRASDCFVDVDSLTEK
jgi:hypothetical protein